MHDTGMMAGKVFIENYWSKGKKKILDVGARDVNGSLREYTPKGAEFVGLDIEAANGVDVVLPEPGADFPFKDDTFDLLVSTSCFEHDQMFWHTFTEMVRVCRPGGFVYINAPSNGRYHSYPYDNWRFYPDSSLALVAWAKKMGQNPMLVESLTLRRGRDVWNDYIMIFAADADAFEPPAGPMLSDVFSDAMNIRRYDTEEVLNFSVKPEDMQINSALRKRVKRLRAAVQGEAAKVAAE